MLFSSYTWRGCSGVAPLQKRYGKTENAPRTMVRFLISLDVVRRRDRPPPSSDPSTWQWQVISRLAPPDLAWFLIALVFYCYPEPTIGQTVDLSSPYSHGDVGGLDNTWFMHPAELFASIAVLSIYPGYFREPHWLSMGLPEISKVT